MLDKAAMSELVARTHRRLDDTGVPTRWDSADILRYLNEAECEAARCASFFRDDTLNAVSLVTLIDGQRNYLLHPSVYDLYAARWEDTQRPLIWTSEDVLDRRAPGWRNQTSTRPGFFVRIDPRTQRLTLCLSRQASVPDGDTVQVRLDTLRYPVENKALGDETDLAAEDDDYLIHWAAYRCYLHRDPDLYDPVKAAEEKALFTTRFGERPARNVETRQTIRTSNQTIARKV